MYAASIPGPHGKTIDIVNDKLEDFQEAVSYNLDKKGQEFRENVLLNAFVAVATVVVGMVTLITLKVYGLASQSPIVLTLACLTFVVLCERSRRRISGQGSFRTIWQLLSAIRLCKRELRFCAREAVRSTAT